MEKKKQQKLNPISGGFLGGVFFWAVTLLGGVAAVESAYPADEIYNIVIKKQDEKARSRWSLADWLDTRDRMRMMDLWLALHSPSPFEFYFGGDARYAWAPVGTLGWHGYAGFYASLFGLQFQYENFQGERLLASFHLRVFGLHNQATNLTPEIGLKQDYAGGLAFRSPYLGVGLTLYFSKFFGVDGSYRHFFSSTPTAMGTTQFSDRFEGGAFIELRVLRLYLNFVYEPTWNGAVFNGFTSINSGARIYL